VARRVLILSWEYPPIVGGGLVRHVRKLSEGLVRRGVAVHVLTRGRESDLGEEVRPRRQAPARAPPRARRGRELGGGQHLGRVPDQLELLVGAHREDPLDGQWPAHQHEPPSGPAAATLHGEQPG
jgi:glycosyltransferase involved in cell wall biosynthesis